MVNPIDKPTLQRVFINRLPITWLAVVFVVFVCLSLVAIDGWQSWSARRVQLQEAKVATTNMATAIAQHADDTIKEADTALVGLVERVQTDGTSPAALERLHRLLVQRVGELDQLNGLFVYDEKGNWLVNSMASMPANVNNADRNYFIYHRKHLDSAPFIGLPIQSRSNGAWILTVSRRINHPDGSFAGVALATINMDYFNKFYDHFEIGKRGAIVLALDAGMMLTRRPLLYDSIGKNIANSTVFVNYVSRSKFGTISIVSSQDGVKRIHSFRHVEHYPLFVVAALSEEEILAVWLSDTYLHSAGVALLLLVLVVFGFHLVRQIQRRVHAEAEIVQARDALLTLNKTLEQLSLQDSLTGLSNRRHFDIALEKEFKRAMRNGRSLALIMIDADYFKQYNDMYGHTEGDECLRTISQIVKSNQNRPGDLAVRYGGEELAILLPDTDLRGAMTIAENIRYHVHRLAIEHSGSPFGVVTISAGVEAYVPFRNEQLPLELVQAADKALYNAKADGRNRVCFNTNIDKATLVDEV
ncbi:sensor domain-containing diguanylate cyclase [Glaciimonas sp. GNP009]